MCEQLKLLQICISHLAKKKSCVLLFNVFAPTNASWSQFCLDSYLWQPCIPFLVEKPTYSSIIPHPYLHCLLPVELMLQYTFRIAYAYKSNLPIYKAQKTFSRKITSFQNLYVHTFIIVVRITFFCRTVLEAFCDMYRFSSECSENSE